MTGWTPELCETYPGPFEKINDDLYIQRKDVHEVEYHALDGSQTFKGYECFRREVNHMEYLHLRVLENI